MPQDIFYLEVDGLDDMEDDFAKASVPAATASNKKLENLFYAGAAAVASRVHVLTGKLLASGRADTHYVADTWIGEIQYNANPGIFELARGDSPTRFHPTGGHFFFNAVEPFIPHMTDAVNAVFDDYFSKAPI